MDYKFEKVIFERNKNSGFVNVPSFVATIAMAAL
jgi:hypothetical protein